MKNREILSHQKIFRQINSLVTYLVKLLLPRNFCQKCVRENSRNFHTVHSTDTVLKNKNLLTEAKFREINLHSDDSLHT